MQLPHGNGHLCRATLVFFPGVVLSNYLAIMMMDTGYNSRLISPDGRLELDGSPFDVDLLESKEDDVRL